MHTSMSQLAPPMRPVVKLTCKPRSLLNRFNRIQPWILHTSLRKHNIALTLRPHLLPEFSLRHTFCTSLARAENPDWITPGPRASPDTTTTSISELFNKSCFKLSTPACLEIVLTLALSPHHRWTSFPGQGFKLKLLRGLQASAGRTW